MPQHETPHSGSADEWLLRARSNFVRATAPRPEGALWEDLCYDAQQTAEKAIKAVIRHKGVGIPRVHDIGELIEILEQNGCTVPDSVKEASTLSNYAVMTRYPGVYEPITEKEFRDAVSIAQTALDWAASVVNADGNP